MSDAIYLTEETAHLAASYIRGPQVKSVRVVRLNFEKYQPIIVWNDNTVSGMKVWMAEWFSINVNHGVQA